MEDGVQTIVEMQMVLDHLVQTHDLLFKIHGKELVKTPEIMIWGTGAWPEVVKQSYRFMKRMAREQDSIGEDVELDQQIREMGNVIVDIGLQISILEKIKEKKFSFWGRNDWPAPVVLTYSKIKSQLNFQ